MNSPENSERRLSRRISVPTAAERRQEPETRHESETDRVRRRYAHSLVEEPEVIGFILDSVPDVVITCSQDLLIKTVNSSCQELLGYRQEELVGSRLIELISGLSERERAFAQDIFVLNDIALRKSDGATIEVELRGRRTCFYDQPMLVIIIHDISERKAAERMKDKVYRQLHESRRLEAIGALASGIAHELNTPIQFIGDNVTFIGLSLDKIYRSYKNYDALKTECERQNILHSHVELINSYNEGIDLGFLSKEIYAAMQETMDGIKQVRDIVLLMKEFAHPGTGAPEATDINLVINGALTICRSRTKNIVSVDTDLAPSAPLIMCRKGQIQQVLMNLIINAVEAMEEKDMKTGRVQITTKMGEAVLRIEICDTGPGIPYELRDKIFDPFFTTKRVGKGTGQGLALSKDIVVKQHGGRLFLDNRLGFSTSFVIELPVEPVQISASEERAGHAPSR